MARSVTQEIAKGRECVTYFHNRAVRYSNYTVKSVDELLLRLAKNKPNLVNIYLEGLGFSIYEVGPIQMSDARIKAAMEKLADDGQGKIPSDFNAFFNSLSVSGVKIDWIDLTKTVSTEVASTITDKVSSFANYLPYLLGAGIIIGVAWKVK